MSCIRALLRFALFAVFVAPGAAAEERGDAAGRPNVLFIAVDDLNDWISCLGGHPDCRTPNIDRLAARGVLFERAYCAAPACNPSRTALLTGIRPSTSGVYVNANRWRQALPDAVTLPQLFMAGGYRVVGGGKIFHGGQNDAASWHEFFPQGRDPGPAVRPANGIANTAHFDWGPLAVDDDQMNDHRVVSWAVDQLQKDHDQPLFLACGIYRPHLPWYVPEEYFDQYPAESVTLPTIYEKDLDDVPPIGRRMARPGGDHRKVIQSNNWRQAVQGYLASIAFADAQIGRLVDALDASGHAEDTIVVLWGDHGWHLGEKLHWRKFSLWEEACRAPLVFVVPGVTEPNGRSPRTVSFIDVYPTLAELCGLPSGEHLEGATLRPLLADPDAAWDRPAVTTHGKDNHAVVSERYRYIRYADGTEELYDHEADPLEWENVASSPEHAAAKAGLAQWLPQTNVAAGPR
jgi:arylsulfatase A-like enzyme